LGISISSVLNLFKRVAILCITAVVAVLMTGIASAFNVDAASVQRVEFSAENAVPKIGESDKMSAGQFPPLPTSNEFLQQQETSKEIQSPSFATEPQNPLDIPSIVEIMPLVDIIEPVKRQEIFFDLPATGGPDLNFLPDSIIHYDVTLIGFGTLKLGDRQQPRTDLTITSLKSSMMLVSAVVSCLVSKQYYFNGDIFSKESSESDEE